MVSCPICGQSVYEAHINAHLDSGCKTHMVGDDGRSGLASPTTATTPGRQGSVSNFFRVSSASSVAPTSDSVKREAVPDHASLQGENSVDEERRQQQQPRLAQNTQNVREGQNGGPDSGDGGKAETGAEPQWETHSWPSPPTVAGQKRSAAALLAETMQTEANERPHTEQNGVKPTSEDRNGASEEHKAPAKRAKPTSALQRAQPLAERMRPQILDEVLGQDLLSPTGVLRNLILTDKIPSMILWGGAGTGKTTIARLMAQTTGARFVELNSTSTGVAELKKFFSEARADLSGVAARKTIMFCDEIHRFSRSQQDVFLGPVEAGIITLVGATTENPSFKVQSALLSRCRVFTLETLHPHDVERILERALEREGALYGVDRSLVDQEMIRYLAAFAEGDARTGLNLLELAMDLSSRPAASKEGIKASLTKTLVYDRAGDQHYNTISAFHKSIRGSDPHAALYYLARMIQSGEDPLYIARRMVVIASEDVGLADNSMLTLATSTYAAAEKIGLPEARINLAHCAVALALSRKSTRAYRGLANATAALKKPGVANLPIPIHLRNAPTRLMKEMGYGDEYKYNPSYLDGLVKQEYLPKELQGSVFLEELDLGTKIDEELESGDDHL